MKFIKNNIIVITFILTSLLNSLILVNITCGINNIRFLIIDLIILLLICGFSKFVKNKKIYYLIFSTLLTIICTINSFFYSQFNDFLSVYLIETFFQALDLPSEAITNVFEFKDYIFLIPLIIMILVIIFSKKEIKVNNNYFKVSFILSVIMILTFTSNDIYRFKNTWNNVYQVRNFGIYTYQLKDISELFINLFDFNKEKAVKEVNEFYKNKQTKENEYTNIFKDKNVILIHAESIQAMFIEESINGQKIMPNLSKMIDEGLYFSNYYSTESIGTSSDTEFTLNNSILPAAFGTVFLNYENNNYQSTMELLKNNGYYTFSMHGNTCEYWNRNNMYKSLQYDHYYCYDEYDLTDKIGLGLSDKSFFNQSADKIKTISENYNKYYGTLIMLTNHTPFYNEGKANYDVGPLEGSIIGDYIKLLNYADEAIGELITKLDELELLENTVIVIYGDHDAKFKESDYELYFEKIHNKEVDLDFFEYENLTKVPLLIWTKDKSVSGKVDKIMSSLDVMPTLGNMLGIDSKYALGNDIFSVEDNIVVFPNGNFRTDKVYYNAQNDEYKSFENIDINYIKEKEKYANKIVEVSNYLLKYDLIKD